MAQRLILVAHGATAGTRELRFGDRTGLLDPGAVGALSEHVVSWSSAPEPACVATARCLGQQPQLLSSLSGLDVGSWSGCPLSRVAETDPDGLRSWLSDPTAAPHGGESLATLIERVGTFCDGHDWAQGRNLVVVTPLVARAMAVHALGVDDSVIFRVDLSPLGRVGLSRAGSTWRLLRLG